MAKHDGGHSKGPTVIPAAPFARRLALRTAGFRTAASGPCSCNALNLRRQTSLLCPLLIAAFIPFYGIQLRQSPSNSVRRYPLHHRLLGLGNPPRRSNSSPRRPPSRIASFPPSRRTVMSQQHIPTVEQLPPRFVGAPMTDLSGVLAPRKDGAFINADELRPALNENHFLALLALFGEEDGLKKDLVQGSYNDRLVTLTKRIRSQVVAAVADLLPAGSVVDLDVAQNKSFKELRRLTAAAMDAGTPVIAGGAVEHDVYRVRARIPILMHASVVHQLFNLDIEHDRDADDARVLRNVADPAAPLNSAAPQALYIAVTAQRRVFAFDRFSVLRGNQNTPTRSMLWVYSWLLAHVQGTDKVLPAVGIGMSSARWIAKENSGGPLVNEYAAGVVLWSEDGAVSPAVTAALDALKWQIKMVEEGRQWIAGARESPHYVAGEPGAGIAALARGTRDPRLRPCMTGTGWSDWPWAAAKRRVAESIGEVTLISGIGRDMGCRATREGVNDFRDSAISAQHLGIDKRTTETIWRLCKPDYDGPPVVPDVIEGNLYNWRGLLDAGSDDKDAMMMPMCEERSFYVDFELASPLEVLVDAPPVPMWSESGRTHRERFGRNSVIFMIGCGQMVRGQWEHRSFVAEALTYAAEEYVINAWMAHMKAMLPADFPHPIVYMWGPEKHLLEKALKRRSLADSVVADFKNFDFVDVLKVVQSGGVVVRGMLRSTLKEVVRALQTNRLIGGEEETRDTAIANGADAMALALTAADYVNELKLESLSDAPQMEAVMDYNESDCLNIARVLYFLRANH